MEDLDKIKAMSVDDATRYITGRDLDDAEREAVLALAGASKGKVLPMVAGAHNRKVWLAAAWLLGASFRQLAESEGIAQQTVLRYVDRVLPKLARQTGRLGTSMSLEALSTYHAKFMSEDPRDIDPDPIATAKWLLAHTELDK